MESARAMLSHSGLPNSYWAEAVSTAVHIRNRSESSTLKEDQTPYEKWHGKKPDVSHFKVFGCIAYAHIPDSQRRKLDKKAQKYRFVGYCMNSKGYRLFDETKRKVVKKRDVIFNELNFAMIDTNQQGEVTVDLDSETEPEQTNEQSNSEDTQQQQRQSSRTRTRPVRFGFDEYADVVTVDHLAYRATQVPEPKTMEEALSSDAADEWKAAADSEYSSLQESQTWELVKLPPNREAVLQGEDSITIHQKQYILRLFKKFRMEDAKPVSTPADVSVKLTKEDGVSKDESSTEFQSLVGSLLYAAIATRPDISQAVGAISKFCSNPTTAHARTKHIDIRFHYVRRRDRVLSNRGYDSRSVDKTLGQRPLYKAEKNDGTL